MQSAAYAARPLARAISQKTRSTYELFVTVTAVQVVVRTLDVSVVVVCVVAAVVELAAGVASAAARVAGCSGAFVTYRFALANPNEPAKIANVAIADPSFSPQAGTGPDRLIARPGPVFAGIGGRWWNRLSSPTWIPVGGAGVLRNS
jgi:hypothetical protein